MAPSLPTSLAPSVDGKTYTATTVAKTVYTLSYDFGTASMNVGTDGQPPALPASQTAYENDTLIVAANVNLRGNSAPHAFFIYWSTHVSDAGNNPQQYYPGDSIVMTKDIILYPIFGPGPVVPTEYKLNIEYVFSDGNKPVTGFEDVVDRAIDVNSDFTVTSPTAPAGYSVDVASVVVLNPTGNITRTVTYTPLTYQLTFIAEDHVTLTVPSGAGYVEVTAGKEYTLDFNVNSVLPELPTAIAEAGYGTPSWSPTLPTALDIELDGSTFTASTQITVFTLNINYVFSGSAKPATGYENVVDQAITVEDSFTVTSPAAPVNHTVNIASVVVDHPTANISTTVTYTYIPPVVTNVIDFVAGAGGSLSGTTSYTFVSGTAFGTAVTTIPTPVADTDYEFVGWTPLLPAAGTAISADITFTALFEFVPPVIPPVTYTVTFTAGEGGSLTGTETITVEEGTLFSEVVVPTPVAAEGYEFDAWTPVLPADATEITEDLSFVANFNEVEEIVEPDTPETPEVAAEGCWIHWLMLLLTLVYGLYEGIRLNKKEEYAQKGGNK